MTHNLILAYGMYKKMEIYRPHPATDQEMIQFHSADYIDFLKRVTPDNANDFLHSLQKCPFFSSPLLDDVLFFGAISCF